jgi:putative membrane protein
VPDPIWTRQWTWDPLVLAALLVSATLFTVGAVRMYQRAGVIRPWHALAHGAGLVVIALALMSPLDHASDILFSAHMAQHELLMLVAAPLIVLGRPLAPALWALPRSVRRAAPWFARPWRFLSAPIVALALHTAARWLWHIPSLFNAALANESVHAVQHLTFFLTAVLFWWTLIHGRYGRVGYGVGVAFVLITVVHSGLLAAVIELANEPLYAHGTRTIHMGMDALVDQQRAGLVMWVPAGVIMMGIGLAIFAAWLGQSARTMAQSAHPSLRNRFISGDDSSAGEPADEVSTIVTALRDGSCGDHRPEAARATRRGE